MFRQLFREFFRILLVLLGHKNQANGTAPSQSYPEVYDTEIFGFCRGERGL